MSDNIQNALTELAAKKQAILFAALKDLTGFDLEDTSPEAIEAMTHRVTAEVRGTHGTEDFVEEVCLDGKPIIRYGSMVEVYGPDEMLVKLDQPCETLWKDSP